MAESSTPAPYVSPWTFDLSKVSRRKWLDWVSGKLSADEDDQLLAGMTGMTVDQVQAMSLPEYKGLMRAFVVKAREPLADPNSPAPSGTA